MIRGLDMNADCQWLETAHFAPEENEIVFFTYRGVVRRGRYRKETYTCAMTKRVFPNSVVTHFMTSPTPKAP